MCGAVAPYARLALPIPQPPIAMAAYRLAPPFVEALHALPAQRVAVGAFTLAHPFDVFIDVPHEAVTHLLSAYHEAVPIIGYVGEECA